MKRHRRVLRRLLILLAPLALAACKHTLEIEGRGDIIELVNGERGCALEEFEAGFSRCTDNEVSDTETVVYRALPRPGWRFSHWDGICSNDSPGDDCQLDFNKEAIEIWDSEPRDPLPPLRAVFVQDGDTLDGAGYIAAQFGGEGNSSYATLLDFLLTDAGYFRYTAQQAGTRNNFDRQAVDYRVDSDGLLALRKGNNWISGGATSADAGLAALVDTTGSDLSVSWLQPKRDDGGNSQFQGSYYCGHISTRSPGYARFFRAYMNGAGSGTMTVITDRTGLFGSANLSFEVFEDGTASMTYPASSRALTTIVGALSENGDLFTGTEISDSGRGSAVCLRVSSGKTLADVAGEFYGASLQIQAPLLTGVTEFGVQANGNAEEFVLRDSLGDGNYFLDVGYVLLTFGSRLETRYRDGAISPDGRIIFLIETNPGAAPNLAVYIRKQ